MYLLEYTTAVVIFIALNIYILSAGADFGGGVWDLLSWGPRKKGQQKLIMNALAPIWEANHVWLIFVIVVLFVAFPRAFAAISISLHIPLMMALIGIVMRGSAFIFRSYDKPKGDERRRWAVTFAIASIITPVMLGINVGAISSGKIRVDQLTGRVDTDFFSAWLTPFSFVIGFFTLTLFAFIAAVYLILETEDYCLKEDFRKRALWAALGLGVLALAGLILSEEGAPVVRLNLVERLWAIPFHLVTGISAVGAIAALWLRRYALARILAMAQASLILWGWGLAQFPYIIIPDLSITSAASSPQVLRLLLIVVAIGAVLLLPSLWYLYALFKGRKGSVF